MDETSFLAATATAHTTYVSGLVDLDRRRLLDVVVGNRAADVGRWLAGRSDDWRKGVRVVCADPHEGYRKAASAQLRGAALVVDPFHVTALANRALDDVRRRVQQATLGHRGRRDDPLYRVRRVLVTGGERLSERGWQRLAAGLVAGDPDDEVLDAWLAKEHVRDVYLTDDEREASRLLDKALAFCAESEVAEVRRLGTTLASWRAEILAHHATGASNGPTEGLNLLVKKLKRVGHGHRSFANYRLRLLLHCGLAWPPPPAPGLRPRPEPSPPGRVGRTPPGPRQGPALRFGPPAGDGLRPPLTRPRRRARGAGRKECLLLRLVYVATMPNSGCRMNARARSPVHREERPLARPGMPGSDRCGRTCRRVSAPATEGWPAPIGLVQPVGVARLSDRGRPLRSVWPTCRGAPASATEDGPLRSVWSTCRVPRPEPPRMARSGRCVEPVGVPGLSDEDGPLRLGVADLSGCLGSAAEHAAEHAGRPAPPVSPGMICWIHASRADGLRLWVMTQPGPVKSNTKPSPDFSVWHDAGGHLADLAGDRRVEGHDVAGVDGDRLAGGQVDGVEGAVAGEQDRALAGGVDEEPALAAEQVLEPAPLGVELDAGRRRQPAALGDRHRLVGRDAGHDDVAGEVVGDVDPAAGGRRGERGDEQALAAEHRALQALHHARPGCSTATATPEDVAIMAPDSARSCSLGSRVTRATAKDGLWRISTFMAEG